MSNKMALDALTAALDAMEHMANVLNNIDAVDEDEDAQHDAAFEAVRAAIAALQAEPQGWMPIETAPKDEATYFLATNGSGVWVAHWQPVAGSGYRFDNPWRTVMLNHWHIEDKQRRYGPPTHWMPLPAATPPKD